ncbi:MAG TPA: hypothetical protein VNN76_11620 [Bacteroidota bacterium]|nr:hypothetical protein [Bacteroidota bacterium]
MKNLIILAFLLVVGKDAVSQPLDIRGYGVQGGWTLADNDLGMGFAAGGHANIRGVVKGVWLHPELFGSYAQNKKSDAETNTIAIGLNGSASYEFGYTLLDIRPFIGGGGGFAYLISSVRVQDPLTSNTSSLSATHGKLSIMAYGGGRYELNRLWTLYLEARVTVISRFNHFAVSLGVNYLRK